jgi:hypothetical protein
VSARYAPFPVRWMLLRSRVSAHQVRCKLQHFSDFEIAWK